MQIIISVKPSFEDLGNALGSVDFNKFINDEIEKIAFRVERFAKQLTPVKTGRLRASIHTSPMLSQLKSIVSTRTDYAVFVHEGTKYMRARPFMTQGADFAKQSIEGDMVARIDSEFVKAFKRL